MASDIHEFYFADQRTFLKASGDHEAHILAVDQDLREAFVYSADAVGHVPETSAIEDGFLYARNERNFRCLATSPIWRKMAGRAPVRDHGAIADTRELVHHE